MPKWRRRNVNVHVLIGYRGLEGRHECERGHQKRRLRSRKVYSIARNVSCNANFKTCSTCFCPLSNAAVEECATEYAGLSPPTFSGCVLSTDFLTSKPRELVGTRPFTECSPALRVATYANQSIYVR